MKYNIPDYHLHTSYSADCESDPYKVVEAAKKAGLNSICFTDHNDMDYPETPDNLCFDLDIDSYLQECLKIKKAFPDFDLRIGVEQGCMPSTCESLSDYSTLHPDIDFIICSSHVVDGADPYYPECFLYPDGSPKDPSSIYKKYFEDIMYNVTNFSDYNVYGHLDYIFRYGPEKVTSGSFKEKHYPLLKDLIYEILKKIIENGKGIEINTGSLYRGMDFMHPHELILRMYKELGGEILTFGSDSHDLTHIGHAFDMAAEAAENLGFRYYTTFRNMKPEMKKIM